MLLQPQNIIGSKTGKYANIGNIPTEKKENDKGEYLSREDYWKNIPKSENIRTDNNNNKFIGISTITSPCVKFFSFHPLDKNNVKSLASQH